MVFKCIKKMCNLVSNWWIVNDIVIVLDKDEGIWWGGTEDSVFLFYCLKCGYGLVVVVVYRNMLGM